MKTHKPDRPADIVERTPAGSTVSIWNPGPNLIEFEGGDQAGYFIEITNQRGNTLADALLSQAAMEALQRALGHTLG
jgi:hypothetical protein